MYKTWYFNQSHIYSSATISTMHRFLHFTVKLQLPQNPLYDFEIGIALFGIGLYFTVGKRFA